MVMQLHEIDPEVDFPAISECWMNAYENPHQNFVPIFFVPGLLDGPEGRRAALEEAAARRKLWHVHDPSSHWKKVVDTETGRIAGAAELNIYKENPFAQPDDFQVTWYPDDSSRAWVEQAFESYATPRYLAGQRPHVYLHDIFTHSDYRRRGVGQQLMDWTISKADELGLDCFLDATLPGKPLYEANGFIVVQENVTAPTTEQPDDKWKEMDDKVGPFTFWLMWRPAGGNYQEGKTVKPWEA